MAFLGVYSNRRVLVTGHTGFKGSWLCTWLLHMGARVGGFSLDIPTVPSNFQVLHLQERIQHFQGDIRDREVLGRVIDVFEPEIVFHLAAQSLVRRAYADPALTFATNALGTMNVLECIRQRPSIPVGVIITSDKCYRNVEWIWGYRENDTLGGDDPYSASKACAELISHAYIKSYFRGDETRVATTRAGNVIGGGDWAPDRIVPDCISAWSEIRSVRIRNPKATRPWQHVLESLSGYLWLGARLWEGDTSTRGEAFNFGPPAIVNQSVEELISAMAEYWPGATWTVEPTGQKDQRESTLLKLCCDKALSLLKWRAILSFSETIRLTAEWYRTYYEKGDSPMYDMTCQQIEEYTAKAAAEGMIWTSL